MERGFFTDCEVCGGFREIHKDGEIQTAYNGFERDCAACSVQGSLASHRAESEMRMHWG